MSGLNRRRLLKGAGATLGALAFAKAVEPVFEFTGNLSGDEFLQKHYRELSPDDLREVLARLEAET
ncbi:MAG: twin-arginine translocation signal domain-containing protein, partial [Planctomycetes bacterium]|nr:twin-arginine translocation signal domain-containing protein [Planctomycetota bacterium]